MRLTPHPFDTRLRELWQISRIYWLAVLTVTLWIALRAQGIGGPPLERPHWLVALVLLTTANLALRTLSSLRPDHARRGFLFTLFDLTVIAAGVRLSGGQDSPLWVALFVLVLAETVLSPPREAHLVCWAAGAALIAGTLPRSPGILPYILDIGLRLFFLVSVSSVTRRLREHAAHRDAEIAHLRIDLAAAGERARLARDIHDSIGNTLAATVLRLEVAARTVDKRPQEAAAVLREEATALRGSMNAIRDWTFFTRPWTTGDEAETAAVRLEREIVRLGQRTGMRIELHGVDTLDTLSPAVQAATLRILQEALTNTAKHSGEKQATVAIACEGGGVRLTVADRGCGFDPASGAGIGLSSIRERTEALGGRYELETSPGQGVRISVWMPCGRSIP